MAEWLQRLPNSCGAAALMCAAIEQNVQAIPALPAVHFLWNAARPLQDPDQASELMLYAVTCGADLNHIPDAGDGYSMPSLICRCAGLLGLPQCTVYLPNTAVAWLLTQQYPNEEEAVVNVGGALLERLDAPEPPQGRHLLRILRVGGNQWWNPAVGLHYVLVRSDGTVMDPGLGFNAGNLAMLIEHADQNLKISYIDTGIGILV